jgi:hypothetical protein
MLTDLEIVLVSALGVVILVSGLALSSMTERRAAARARSRKARVARSLAIRESRMRPPQSVRRPPVDHPDVSL